MVDVQLRGGVAGGGSAAGAASETVAFQHLVAQLDSYLPVGFAADGDITFQERGGGFAELLLVCDEASERFAEAAEANSAGTQGIF